MNDVLTTIRRQDYTIQHIIGPFSPPESFIATEEIANAFKIPIVSVFILSKLVYHFYSIQTSFVKDLSSMDERANADANRLKL